jgi:hypothetical protein
MFPHARTCRHAVLFYQDDAAVCHSVTGYVTAALRQGQPALVIAKPALLQELTLEVHRQHVQGDPFGPQRGRFVSMDAEATLAKICRNGKPDRGLFGAVIGGALEELGAGGQRVAAYGEMVGVLCERGQFADAVVLEGMWNELLVSAHASLFCGYARQLFKSSKARTFYDQIRAAHSEVLGEGAAVPA